MNVHSDEFQTSIILFLILYRIDRTNEPVSVSISSLSYSPSYSFFEGNEFSLVSTVPYFVGWKRMEEALLALRISMAFRHDHRFSRFTSNEQYMCRFIRGNEMRI